METILDRTTRRTLVRGAASSYAVVLFGILLAFVCGWILSGRPDPAAAANTEPAAPAPHREREVSFASGDVRLAGTLTIPAGSGPFPAVALVSGAGAQDRDGEIYGHRRYRIVSEALARNGIAVLRTDDRGVGGSTGNLHVTRYAELAEDALQAVRFLAEQPEIDARWVGLIGGSQGSAVVALAAAGSSEVAFVVLKSCLGLPGRELFVEQQLRLVRATGMPKEQEPELRELIDRALAAASSPASEEERLQAVRRIVHRLDELVPAGFAPLAGSIELRSALLLSPIFEDRLRFDPAPVLERLTQPALVVSGELDFQVDPEPNLAAVRAALERAGNPDFEIHLLPGLNHFLQPAETGHLSEYPEIDVAVAPEAVELIVSWIR